LRTVQSGRARQARLCSATFMAEAAILSKLATRFGRNNGRLIRLEIATPQGYRHGIFQA
jgi:hypothetical protein